jgi:hypothetical protein
MLLFFRAQQEGSLDHNDQSLITAAIGVRTDETELVAHGRLTVIAFPSRSRAMSEAIAACGRVTLLLLASPAIALAHHAAAKQMNSSDDRRNVGRAADNANIEINKTAYICVTTTYDKSAIVLIEKSGEYLPEGRIGGLSTTTSGYITESLQSRFPSFDVVDRPSGEPRMMGVVTAIPSPCRTKRDVALVHQHIALSPSGSGYVFSVEINYDQRQYRREIVRESLPYVEPQERERLGPDATRRLNGDKFWSLYGDYRTVIKDTLTDIIWR